MPMQGESIEHKEVVYACAMIEAAF